MEFRKPTFEIDWKSWLIGFGWESWYDYIHPTGIVEIYFHAGPMTVVFEVHKEYN